jgi:hypothetical protein
MATTMTVCGSCSAHIAGTDFLYNPQGLPMCAGCADKTDLANTDRRAANNIVRAGWAALGASLLAFAAGMMLLGIIADVIAASSIVSAVFCLVSFSGNSDRFSKLLTAGQRTTAFACSIVGLLFSALTVFGVATSLGIALVVQTT